MLKPPHDHTPLANEDSQILEINGKAFINWLKDQPEERTRLLQKLRKALAGQGQGQNRIE